METALNQKSWKVDEAATKKKYAVLFGYCGTGYHGSQTNKGTDTIDDDLMEGLHKAGCLSDPNFFDEKKYVKNGWNRAARTDKGVHAAGNVINCKLEIVNGKEEEIVKRINQCLPSAIQVFKIVRTTKNFNSKNYCDRRQYEYILPIYTLKPFSAESSVLSIAEDIQTTWPEFIENAEYLKAKETSDGTSITNPFTEVPTNRWRIKSLSIAQEMLNMIDSFSIYTADTQDAVFGGVLPVESWPEYLSIALERLRACMSLFVGTHNFHNYTVGKTAYDASSQRHLLAITVSDPIQINSEAYIRIRLEGQSFMLHQIRKMIGMSVEVARGRSTLHTIHSSLSRGDLITPMAPSTGLFLDQIIFGEYNKKQKDDTTRMIDFNDELIANCRCEFKRVQIYEHIDKQIKEENVFHAWLSSNDSFAKEYKVVYSNKEDIVKLEQDAKDLNRSKRIEKEEKWEKKRKIVTKEEENVLVE